MIPHRNESPARDPTRAVDVGCARDRMMRARALAVGTIVTLSALLVLLLLSALSAARAQVAASAGASAPSARFQHAPAAAIRLGEQVLSDDERAYLAALPEIRVAIPVPAASPYETVAADGVVAGIHSEILGSLARTFGLRVRPVLMPGWTAALDAVRRRDADLIMTIGVTNERTAQLEFTLGVTPWPGALFARIGAADKPLARARFALERDYLANDFVRRQHPEATILTVETTRDALAAVADGRADYYLGALFEAVDAWSNSRVAGVEVRRLLNYGTGHYHFAVRKDWARLAIILNKGISALQEVTLPQWQAAVDSLPPNLAMPPRLTLSASERALLINAPMWRLGAVRGLALLNDIDDAGRHSGIAAEYAEHVARRLGVGLQVVGYDSVAAMLAGLRRGEVDLVPFLTRTPAREREFVYSVPYVEMPYLLVARTSDRYFWDLDSLRGRRVALAAEHPLREVIARGHPGIQIVDARDGNAAMEAVARGAADAAVEVKLFANLHINADRGARLRAVAAVDALPAQFHFAAAPRRREMIAIVDRVVAEIPASERERMLRRWVAIDLDPPFPWRRHLPTIAVGAAALLAALLLTLWWMRRLSREVAQRRASEQQLHDIGSTLPCVAFRHVVDASGTLLDNYFSPGSQAFLGVPLDRARSMLENLAPHLREDGRQAAVEAVRHSLRTGEPFKLTAAFVRRDGTLRWLHCDAVRRDGRDGTTKSWTGYIVDVTGEHELQRRLADEARRRNLTLASASHELRAPTHTVALALQALETGAPGERPQALAVAKDAVHTLTQLLGDVLDAAQLNHGEVRLAPRVFELRPWIDQLVDAVRPWAESKALRFEWVVDAGLPPIVMMDPLRLRQVAINLLSNAIKYTDRGVVRLRVGLDRDAAGAPLLVLAVADSGRGIDPAQLEQVFTPFATADDPPVAAGGSSGLGLSICRQLASMMSGRIVLGRLPGGGTLATFEAPLRPVAGAPDAARARTVLVCDDDELSRMLLAHMLASHGLEVEQASSAAEALTRLQRRDVGLLLTDLRMQGMSGLDLLRAIAAAATPERPRPRVIVCSGDAAPPPADAALYDAFIVKPIQMPTLLATLAAVGFAPPAGASIAPPTPAATPAAP